MTTVTQALRLFDFNKITESEQDKLIESLADAALYPNEVTLLKQQQENETQIKIFECRYEMSSSEMIRQLSDGLLKETAEICSWILLLRLRDNLESGTTTARSESFKKLC